MRLRKWTLSTGMCGLMMLGLPAVRVGAQEVKAKAPMYSYVANWQVSRDKWGDAEKSLASIQAVLEKSASQGQLVGYGTDAVLVHDADGATHDTWWAANSMADLLKVLDAARTAGLTGQSIAILAGKHWDQLLVSRYYNRKTGAYKAAYTHIALYKFKGDAPDDALDQISQHIVVPLMEKLFADGTILEYEVDTEAIHNEDPNLFAIVYQTATPEGIDKVQGALRDYIKEHPLGGRAVGLMTEDKGHRDYLMKGDGAYK